MHGSPIVIYNEVLAKLKHELCDPSKAAQSPAKYMRLTAELFLASTQIYASESERGNAVYGLVRRLLGGELELLVEIRGEDNRKIAEADAAIRQIIRDDTFGENKAVVAAFGLKNGVGVYGDGGLQAALTATETCVSKNIKSLRPLLIFHAADFESLQYEEIRNVSCRPCIIISITGPYFQVSGAVFVEGGLYCPKFHRLHLVLARESLRGERDTKNYGNMIESIMLPRFSVPSRRQWKPYNDTMRIYVYKISLNWLVYSLAPLIFRAHLRLEMSYSKADFFSKGRILATIVSPCFSQDTRERVFASSFASGTANC